MTVDASGTYAFVAHIGSDSISQFSISADGSLTQIDIPTWSGTSPVAIATTYGY